MFDFTYSSFLSPKMDMEKKAGEVSIWWRTVETDAEVGKMVKDRDRGQKIAAAFCLNRGDEAEKR